MFENANEMYFDEKAVEQENHGDKSLISWLKSPASKAESPKKFFSEVQDGYYLTLMNFVIE